MHVFSNIFEINVEYIDSFNVNSHGIEKMTDKIYIKIQVILVTWYTDTVLHYFSFRALILGLFSS